MKDEKGLQMSNRELHKIKDEMDTAENTQPRYNIGAKLCRRDNLTCFGSVIDRYIKNGQLAYRIMGSDTKPMDIAEGELELK